MMRSIISSGRLYTNTWRKKGGQHDDRDRGVRAGLSTLLWFFLLVLPAFAFTSTTLLWPLYRNSRSSQRPQQVETHQQHKMMTKTFPVLLSYRRVGATPFMTRKNDHKTERQKKNKSQSRAACPPQTATRETASSPRTHLSRLRRRSLLPAAPLAPLLLLPPTPTPAFAAPPRFDLLQGREQVSQNFLLGVVRK